MDIKNVVKSKEFKVLLYIIGATIVLLFVFQFGMYVGFKKATFSNRVGNDYFQQMHEGLGRIGVQPDDFINAHGAIGQIISVKLPLIVVEDRNNFDKVIRLSSSTAVKGPDGVKSINDLKVNDFVIIFGDTDNDADDPTIAAQLVRILPTPMNSFMSSSTTQ
jgi:hypothetical protein